jgi:hypothetical protein
VVVKGFMNSMWKRSLRLAAVGIAVMGTRADFDLKARTVRVRYAYVEPSITEINGPLMIRKPFGRTGVYAHLR